MISKTLFGKSRKTSRVVALMMMLLLLAGMLSGCGDKPDTRDPKNETITPKPTAEASATPTDAPAPTDTPTPEPTAEPVLTDTPTPEPTDEPVPTDTPTPEPTEEPVPTDTPTPEPTATETPAPTPQEAFGTKWEDYTKIWYSDTISSLEMEETDCSTDPYYDYHLYISVWSEDDVILHLTHMIPYYDDYSESEYIGVDTGFELITSEADLDMEMYASWNYGVTDYLKNMTDISKGHLIFRRTYSDQDEVPSGALLIVDAMPDHTLKTELIYVLDNGSFPVFVTTVFTQPEVAMGSDYNDYLGTWHVRSYASYYGDGFEVEGDEPEFTLVFNADGTVDFGGYEKDDNDRPVYEGSRYRLCTEFSEEALEAYRTWDKTGILAMGKLMAGIAMETAKEGTDLDAGRLIFSDDADNLLYVTWTYDYGLHLSVYSISLREVEEDVREELLHYNTDEFTRMDVPYIEEVMYYTFYRDFNRTKPEGSFYEDFIGVWDVVDYSDDPEGAAIVVTDPEKFAKLQINADMTVNEILDNNIVATYVIRLDAKSSDPSWYKDQSLANVVTDYQHQQLVLKCTSGNNKDALLILHMNGEKVAQATYYSQNNASVSVRSLTYRMETAGPERRK